MQWSPQQDNALLAVARWLKDPNQQVFRLFGYAGTGKTTLAKHLAAGVSGEVIFAAFTGKAAHVLRQKGCEGATTIHSLIYHTKEKGKARLKDLEVQMMTLKQELLANGVEPEALEQNQRVNDFKALIKKERENLSRPSFVLNHESTVQHAALIVIDECSMVDDQMGADLLSFGTKVLVLGDKAQLPPVGGAGYFTENVDPDIMLDEIHRQAGDNPIIRLATDVRNGKKLSLGQYGTSKIITLEELDRQEVLAVDQIIVGKNATRHDYNARLRELQGRKSKFPEPTDKLVCLRNNHELGLLNGAIWETIAVGHADDTNVMMEIQNEDMDYLEVTAHSHYFLGTEADLPWWERKEAEEFDYGYALTCHKAQGSQWDDLMVFDESYCFRKDRNRWLYTAITRAAEKLTIVRM